MEPSNDWFKFKNLLIALVQSGLIPPGPVSSLGNLLAKTDPNFPSSALEVWSISQICFTTPGMSLIQAYERDISNIFDSFNLPIPDGLDLRYLLEGEDSAIWGAALTRSILHDQVATQNGSGPRIFSVQDNLTLRPLTFASPPLSLNLLLGQQEATTRLIPALRSFLAGHPPQHALLYGPRGTGKSTAVASLIHHPEAGQIKLVELGLNQLGLLRRLGELLSRLDGKFAILLDDLSFQLEDSRWHELKTILEGGLARPFEKVWLLATSNKKDLVWRPEDLHQTLQGKELLQALRALDDRFVLKVPFFRLDQETLMEAILLHLGPSPKGISGEEILPRFYRFCMENNLDEPSGRSARDFALSLNQ